jgi:hypothetical protein
MSTRARARQANSSAARGPVGFVLLASRPSRSLVTENLLLRRQLAVYRERKVRRIDASTVRLDGSILAGGCPRI